MICCEPLRQRPTIFAQVRRYALAKYLAGWTLSSSLRLLSALRAGQRFNDTVAQQRGAQSGGVAQYDDDRRAARLPPNDSL